MSKTDDAITQITAAIGKVTVDIQTLQAEVAADGDDATAAKLAPIVDQLNALDALTPDPAPVDAPPSDAPAV